MPSCKLSKDILINSIYFILIVGNLFNFSDGGIARLRVYGRAVPDWSKISKNSVC